MKIFLKNVTMILEVMGVLNWVLYLIFAVIFSLFYFEICTRNSQKMNRHPSRNIRLQL